MAEATAPVSEARYWKITVNPEECPQRGLGGKSRRRAGDVGTAGRGGRAPLARSRT